MIESSTFLSQHTQAASGVYNDFSDLNRLKNLANRDGDAALERVAQQFESIFLNIALKSMRQANEAFAEDSYFHSNQSRMYQDMLDQQLSVTLTEGKGIGLAETLVKQMAKYVSAESRQQGPDQARDLTNLSKPVRQYQLNSLMAREEG